MIQLTPDEIAQVVLARQRRGPWLAVLTGLTWLLWVATAILTVRLVVQCNDYFRSLPFLTITPVLMVPGVWEGMPPDKDAPPVPGGEVTLLYGHYPHLKPVRPLTMLESLWAADYRAMISGNHLMWAFEELLAVLAAIVLSLLATVLLLTLGRRATLRQIQASLAAIAAQLAEVQRGRGPSPPTAAG